MAKTETTTYKLKDLLKIKNGKDHKALGNGSIPVYGSGGIMRYADSYLYDKASILLPRKGSLDNIQYCDVPFWTVDTIYYTEVNESLCDAYYLYRYLKLLDLSQLDSGTGVPSMTFDSYYQIEVKLPPLEAQKRIASMLKALDSKIHINEQINRNLEALAKQLYDYWFVQFDFPNEEGKPYKSSGGKMVWNEDLQINIPQNWDVCRLNEFISKNNTGDWGADEPSTNSIEVGCIRGADILKLNDLPKRHIKSSNTAKLLSNWDVVIEVSGGSPTQATGRSAYITPGVIKRNGGSITCSNFCHAFSFKDFKDSAYFYFVWRMFYDNNIMFNFEGKTSGIKNFMTEVFLANKWLKPTKSIVTKFFDAVKEIYAKIDSNIAENNNLIKQRDELLPLLMNGQISVNSDLSHD